MKCHQDRARARRRGKRRVYGGSRCGMVRSMESIADRLVIVRAKDYDDVLELARLSVERLPHDDPLALALRGAIANARSAVLPEP